MFAIFEGVHNDLAENLANVRARIKKATLNSGRTPDKVKLVAVSKTHPAEALTEVINAGHNIFGENKLQEAETKIAEIGHERAEWHLIGHLQSNKARKAVRLFDVVQSLDSVELAERLERICLEEGREKLSVFAQVDIARENTKSGVHEDQLPELVEFLRGCRCLQFTGLMLLPPYSEEPEDARRWFKRLREIRDALRSSNAFSDGLGELSMGMTHDFEIAIEEGATVVRIGTAVFGPRVGKQ